MNKKFELLREAVNTYKVNHCDGNKNEKELLEFIDELEQLTIPDVRKSSPLVEGKTKSNVKNNTQTRRLASPPPPIKR